MKASDIPDIAILEYIANRGPAASMYDFRLDDIEIPSKVIAAKLYKIDRRGWINYGVSIWHSWLTPKGLEVLNAMREQKR